MLAVARITFDLPAHFLDEPGERAGFVLLVAFLISFLFIRTSARLMRNPRVTWWPGSVTTDSGLHLHHLVWGIVLLLVSGFLSFALVPVSPWEEILAALFGIGAGLTLDEFALWIHLRDVYWAEEGRASLDAVIVAATLGALVVLGIAPFDLHHNSAAVSSLLVTIVVVLALCAGAIAKGRRFLGLIGVFVPLTSMFALGRLAAPGSPWARRFYADDPGKLRRAQERFARGRARRRRLADAISGAPSAAEASEEPRTTDA